MTIEHFTLPPGPSTPNSKLPVIVYRCALDSDGDLAGAFEITFRRNGWGDTWRNGIFDYHHYHSRAHEALGIAEGNGRVLLGGAGGVECELAVGDCVLLPAGTGHCKIMSSENFLVVGAYPPGQHADMQTQAPTQAVLDAIRHCALPSAAPVDDPELVMQRLWREARR